MISLEIKEQYITPDLCQFKQGQTLAQGMLFEARKAAARGNLFPLLRFFSFLACVFKNEKKRCLGGIITNINI